MIISNQRGTDLQVHNKLKRQLIGTHPLATKKCSQHAIHGYAIDFMVKSCKF